MGRSRGRQPRPVEKLCKETGKVLERFPSVLAAATSVKLTHCAVSKCLNKKARYAADFAWRYEEQAEQEFDVGDDAISASDSEPSSKVALTMVSHGKKLHKVCHRTGRIIRTFNSIREEATHADVTSSCIGNACHGRAKSAAGYAWKLAEEETLAEPALPSLSDNPGLGMPGNDSVERSASLLPKPADESKQGKNHIKAAKDLPIQWKSEANMNQPNAFLLSTAPVHQQRAAQWSAGAVQAPPYLEIPQYNYQYTIGIDPRQSQAYMRYYEQNQYPHYEWANIRSDCTMYYPNLPSQFPPSQYNYQYTIGIDPRQSQAYTGYYEQNKYPHYEWANVRSDCMMYYPNLPSQFPPSQMHPYAYINNDAHFDSTPQAPMQYAMCTMSPHPDCFSRDHTNPLNGFVDTSGHTQMSYEAFQRAPNPAIFVPIDPDCQAASIDATEPAVVEEKKQKTCVTPIPLENETVTKPSVCEMSQEDLRTCMNALKKA